MTLLLPAALWLLLLALPLIALYLMRPRRREAIVSTLQFWQRVLDRSPQRRFLGRLRHPFSLLIFLLLLLALVLSVAKPEWERFLQAESVVLVLDTRGRMLARTDGGETAWERARVAASAYAARASSQSPVAILAAGETPHSVCGFTEEASLAMEALQSIEPKPETGDLAAAVRLAGNLLQARGEDAGKIVVITDRQHLDLATETGVPAEVVAVGHEAANMAISQLAARGGGSELTPVLLQVANFSPETRDVEIEWRQNEGAPEIFRRTIPAGEIETIPRQLLRDRSEAVHLEAKITTPDTLLEDNIATLTLPPIQPLRVLLVSAGNRFLEAYLQADTSVQFELLPPDAWRESFATGVDVVIFDDADPTTELSPEASGNFLFLGASALAAEEELSVPLLTEEASEHPVLADSAWDGVTFLRARPLRIPEGWNSEVLLASGDSPLMVALSSEQRRILALGVRTRESDLPLRIAFPVFLHRALHWLAGRDAEEVFSGSAFAAEESDVREAGTSGESLPWIGSLARLLPWQILALLALFGLAGEWWAYHRRMTE